MSESWSYTDLKRKYGEDAALAMLPHMTGYGEFGRSQPITARQPDPKDIDRCPLCGEAMSSRKPCGRIR